MRFAAATAVVRSAANARSSQRAPVGTVSEISAPAAGVVPAIDRSAPGPSSDDSGIGIGKGSGCLLVTYPLASTCSAIAAVDSPRTISTTKEVWPLGGAALDTKPWP